MLNVYLERRDAPRVDDAVGVYLDIVAEPREHLRANRHVNRRGVEAAHTLLEFGPEARGERRVARDAWETAGRRRAFEAVPAKKAGLARPFVEVAEPGYKK